MKVSDKNSGFIGSEVCKGASGFPREGLFCSLTTPQLLSL